MPRALALSQFRHRNSWRGKQILQVNVSGPAFTTWGERVHVEKWRDATEAEREQFDRHIAEKAGL